MSNLRETVSEAKLRELYLTQGLTVAEISAQLHISPSTIRRRLSDLGIAARSRGPKGSRLLPHGEINEQLLRQLYLEQKLSIPQIAEQCGWGRETVRLKMLEYNIPIRSFSQATLVQHGTWDEYHDFSGDEREKAYLIGFRTGDLHVRREHEGSEVIRVSCTSTKPEQIELIEQAYGKYGHIIRGVEWRVSLKGLLKCLKINVSLNQTFDFLFDDLDHVPAWILADPNLFLAFFGGFTDAEGSFHLQKYKDSVDRGRFSLKNTDVYILEQSHSMLSAMGIRPSSITKVYDAGRQTSKRGVFATKALWEFAVENKESVLRLIELLSPFLRHEKRRADMEHVRQNVEWRNSDNFKQEATEKRLQATKKTNQAKKKNQN